MVFEKVHGENFLLWCFIPLFGLSHSTDA
uniref:Uncharacterized protein n=1 Tax=Rhizophora mucronata TaxID=61149 RepID=A0A2P2PW99_RHIMU